MVRNVSIDSLKGLLIIFVIIGHALFGTLDGNPLRYVIYSFHMPVFLFLSGYLLNCYKISALSIKQLFVKYWKRMLLPWVIALVVYSVVLTVTNFTIFELVMRLTNPYYHLWYIPTLFVFIMLTWIALKIKNNTIAIVLLIIVGILLDSLCIQTSTIRLNYMVFFVVGVIVRNVKLWVDDLRMGGAILFFFLIAVALLSACNVSMDFYIKNLRMPFIMAVCILSVLPTILLDKFKIPFLGYIGEHSLEVYLWHVLPIIVLKHFIPNAQVSCLYYLLVMGLLIMMVVFSWFKTKKVD